ncbi:MAG: hypothetical protein OQL11_12135 [Gammaproteobacteria bacterium]|nr:hypothetical protein [Gammaproteobacteria bacterium]
MSKLEDKLSASIKAGSTPRPETPAAKPAPAKSSESPKPKAKVNKPKSDASNKGSGAGNLNAPVQELHPTRIWPD